MDGSAPPSIIKLPPPISPIKVSETEDPDDEIDDQVFADSNQVFAGSDQVQPRLENLNELLQDEDFSESSNENRGHFPELLRNELETYVSQVRSKPEPMQAVHEWHKNESFYQVVINTYLVSGSVAKTVTNLSGISPSRTLDYQIGR